jgi:tetratricopeptide (TPR) repeat protein
LSISTQIGDQYARSLTLRMIGMVYSITNPDKALEKYNESLSISERSGNLFDIGVTLGNIGNLLIYEGRHAEALSYTFRAYHILKSLKKTKEPEKDEANLESIRSYLGDETYNLLLGKIEKS